MKFWQAFIIADMAAGAVWADRLAGIWWLHLLADAGNVLISYVLWRCAEAIFATRPEPASPSNRRNDA